MTTNTSTSPTASLNSITVNSTPSPASPVAPSRSATPFCKLELGASASLVEWLPPPAAPVLGLDELHLWRFSLKRRETAARDFVTLLAPEELARAQRFFFTENRRRYVIGRGWLRVVLGRYLRVAPSEIVFRYGARGKPYLAWPGATPLCFNVSHTDSLVLIAIARAHAVGVDVEHLHAVADADAVAARFYSLREQAALRSTPTAARAEKFLRLWTQKEACAKAVGRGLDEKFAEVEVMSSEHQATAHVNVPDETGREAHCWLASFALPDEHIGAVAVVRGERPEDIAAVEDE